MLLFRSIANSCHAPPASYVLRSELNLSRGYFYVSVPVNYYKYVCTVAITNGLLATNGMGHTLLLMNSATLQVKSVGSGDHVPLFNSYNATVTLRCSRATGSVMISFRACNGKRRTLVAPRNNFHRPTAPTSFRCRSFNGNVIHTPVRALVGKVGIFSFTVSHPPESIRAFLSSCGVGHRASVSCFLVRRTGGVVISHVIGGLGLPGRGIPCGLRRFKGLNKTSVPSLVIDHLHRQLVRRRAALLVSSFKLKLD